MKDRKIGQAEAIRDRFVSLNIDITKPPVEFMQRVMESLREDGFVISGKSFYEARRQLLTSGRPLMTGLIKHTKENDFGRGRPYQETIFCEKCEKFISRVLSIDFPGNCLKARGLIFGTQSLISVTKNNKIVLDNYYLVMGFCRYVSIADMVIGNLVNIPKAEAKKMDWISEFSLERHFDTIETGPVDPLHLITKVDDHFNKRPEETLLVLMLDSGNELDYSGTFKHLTRKYGKGLYIIKMIMRYPKFTILRVFDGELKIVDIDKLYDVTDEIARMGWEAFREKGDLSPLWLTVK